MLQISEIHCEGYNSQAVWPFSFNPSFQSYFLQMLSAQCKCFSIPTILCLCLKIVVRGNNSISQHCKIFKMFMSQINKEPLFIFFIGRISRHIYSSISRWHLNYAVNISLTYCNKLGVYIVGAAFLENLVWCHMQKGNKVTNNATSFQNTD